MTPRIYHTEYPKEPPQGFNEWQTYIYSLQDNKEPLQRHKREIELSFDKLHTSITTQAIPKSINQ